MNYTLRLQRPWDVDLIALSKHPTFDFNYWVKKALRAWSMDDASFVIPCPPKAEIVDDETTEINKRLNELYEKKKDSGLTDEEKYEQRKLKQGLIITIHIRIEPEKDAKLIERLRKVQDGYRNTFIKNLFRHYLDKPYAYAYATDENDSEALFLTMSQKNINISTVEADTEELKTEVSEQVKKTSVKKEAKKEEKKEETTAKSESKAESDAEPKTETKEEEKAEIIKQEEAEIKQEENSEEVPKMELTETPVTEEAAVTETETTEENEEDGFDLFGAIDKMM